VYKNYTASYKVFQEHQQIPVDFKYFQEL